MRGMGRIYKRSDIYWVEYWHRSKQFRESSQSRREANARRLLKKRLGEIQSKRFVGPQEERVLLTDLLNALETDYENNGRRSRDTLRWRLAPLRAAFALDRALDVTEHRIERYKAAGLAEKRAPATLNRELAALKRPSH